MGFLNKLFVTLMAYKTQIGTTCACLGAFMVQAPEDLFHHTLGFNRIAYIATYLGVWLVGGGSLKSDEFYKDKKAQQQAVDNWKNQQKPEGGV